MKRAIAVLLLTTACSVSQPSETKEDSVAVLSEDTINVDIPETDEIPAVDTIYNVIKLPEKFTRPQIDDLVAYVYNESGLDVYETSAAERPIGHVDFKSKLQLKDALKGDMVPIDFEGKMGFVSAAWIVNLPVPETTDVLKYFIENTMLMGNPVEKRSPEDDQEGSFGFIQYQFENGFRIDTGSQYESGYTIVNLPGVNIRGAFLFASYFYETFEKSFTEFPIEARDEDLPEEKHIQVRVEDGKVTGITVGNGEGCYWEESISATEDGSVMNSSGGC